MSFLPAVSLFLSALTIMTYFQLSNRWRTWGKTPSLPHISHSSTPPTIACIKKWILSRLAFGVSKVPNDLDPSALLLGPAAAVHGERESMRCYWLLSRPLTRAILRATPISVQALSLTYKTLAPTVFGIRGNQNWLDEWMWLSIQNLGYECHQRVPAAVLLMELRRFLDCSIQKIVMASQLRKHPPTRGVNLS